MVSNNRRPGPRVLPPVYSEAVRSALYQIRCAHRDAEASLSAEDRIDLAAALRILAIAGMLEAQLVPLDCPT